VTVYSVAVSDPIPAPNAPTASGNWISDGSGNWGNSANWQGGVIADGAGNSAHFDAVNLGTDITVTLDTSRSIGNLYVGDTNGTNHYTIASGPGAILNFNDNSSEFQVHSILQQSSTSGGDTVSATMTTQNDLEINNLSAAHTFTISGNISGSGSSGSGAFPILWFNNQDTSLNSAGGINVTGNISNGSTGAELDIVVVNGTVTLTGTNTYSGFTEVDGGTLFINGNNSGANGGVFVYSSGTLGGTGTIGGGANPGDVYVYGGTITGGATTTVGTLTMNGSLIFGGEGPGGTYLANLSGNMSDLLAIGGMLSIGSEAGLTIVGTADNVTTYVLATFSSISGTFDPALVMGIPSGYSLVYNLTDIELVPTAIPEPATWIGAAAATAAVVALRIRRRTGRS
jgi:fibronectin-binding autotransporter adhesin